MLRVRVVLICDYWECGERCKATVETLAEVSKRDVAGDVVADIVPDMPSGWTYERFSQCEGHLCPEHDEKRT